MPSVKISILGCGWLGKPLGESLVRKGHTVYGSSTRRENFAAIESLGISPFQIDLSAPQNAEINASFFSCDILIISVPPRLRGGQNHESYLKQVQLLRDEILHWKVPKVIFISSTSVYADTGKLVEEDDADKDSTLYTAESILLQQKQFSTTVLRFAGLVGPARHPGKFLSGKKTTGANNPVNIIHLTDCINIIQNIIDKGVWNEIFNACADKHPTKARFYDEVCRLLDVPPPVFAEGDENGYKIVSNNKLKAALSYSFVFPDPLQMIY